MATKTLQGRIVNKHDSAANWAQAVNFRPMQGELIIYDPDETCSYVRFKIGDGENYVNDLPFADEALWDSLEAVSEQINTAIEESKADWSQNDETATNYIKNRTHYDTRQQGVVTLSFDGNFDGKDIIEIDSAYKWVKVSDFTPAIDTIIGCNMGGIDLGAPFTINITEDKVKQVAENVYTIATATSDDITIAYEDAVISGVTFTKGVWFGSWYVKTSGAMLGYMSMLESSGVVGELKKIDDKYLPIATDEEILEMLAQEDMLPVVKNSDGSLLADENENILLW